MQEVLAVVTSTVAGLYSNWAFMGLLGDCGAGHCVAPRKFLWGAVRSRWSEMGHWVLHGLVGSVPARGCAVVEAGGKHAKCMCIFQGFGFSLR